MKIKMKLQVLITSGGTISKIDDIRHIGNFSEGKTGALTAEEFLKRGAEVHYVYGKNAKRPFQEQLKMNPFKPKEDELKRLADEYDTFHIYLPFLHEYSALTFEQYYQTVSRILTEKLINVTILAAAVSDYSAKKQEGKISSDKETLSIELERNPKIISLVKEWNPKTFLVGFKLLSRASSQELIETASESMKKNNIDLMVANTAINGNFSTREIFILFSKKATAVSARDLAEKLADAVYENFKDKV